MSKIYVSICFIFLSLFGTINAQINYFREVEKAADDDRFNIASGIYYREILPLDSASTTFNINALHQIAQSKNDEQLELLADLFKGEHLFRMLNNECIPYFQNALAVSKKKNFKTLQAQAYHDLGLQFARDSKFNLAFENFLKSNYIIDDIGYNNFPVVSRYLYEFGNIYYQFGDFEKCKRLLLEALKHPVPNTIYGIKIHNTLGLCYREAKQFDLALEEFKQTISLSKNANSAVWVGIGTGNLGSIYYKQNKFDLALPLFKIDYETSLSNKEYRSAVMSLSLLSEIYLGKNKIDSAAYYLSKANDLIHIVHDPVTYRAIYFQQAAFYKKRNDFSNAYKSLDSANYYNNEINNRDFANIRSKAEQKIAVEKYLADLDLVESRKELQILTRNSIIIGLIMIVIIAALLLHKLKIKQRNDKQQIDNAKEQLNLYLDQLKEKNRLIQKFETEVKKLETITHPDDEAISQLQNYTILTEENWIEFRRLFEKVHKGFFEKLRSQYPELTQSEIRLMSLIRLNLSRKEMADMLGISPDSIKKTRQRIKKRLILTENVELEEIVFGL